MIEVLWIDDECKDSLGNQTPKAQEFIESAYDEGIKITPMLNYKDGIEAIKRNPLRWCAVILDIHNQKATTYNPSDDFALAKDEIMLFQSKYNQPEPYIFVLSGNKQYKGGSSIIRKFDHCSKRIYDKNNSDYKILFNDIHKIREFSQLYKCQDRYSDVLILAKDMCGEETYKSVLALLYKIDVLHAKSDSSLFNEMRKILENVLERLRQLGYSYFAETKDKVSLNNLSVYIGKDGTVPEYIQRSFHSLVRIVQNGSHNKEVDNAVKTLKAPYLLKSSLYELCNILIWLGSLDKQ